MSLRNSSSFEPGLPKIVVRPRALSSPYVVSRTLTIFVPPSSTGPQNGVGRRFRPHHNRLATTISALQTHPLGLAAGPDGVGLTHRDTNQSGRFTRWHTRNTAVAFRLSIHSGSATPFTTTRRSSDPNTYQPK